MGQGLVKARSFTADGEGEDGESRVMREREAGESGSGAGGEEENAVQSSREVKMLPARVE